MRIARTGSYPKDFDSFFGSSFRLEFPVLDQDLFEKTIEIAYGPVDENLISPGQTSARACVLGAISFASCQHTRGQVPLSVDAESCAAEAHRLILNITGDMGLNTLQTALLLVSSITCNDFENFHAGATGLIGVPGTTTLIPWPLARCCILSFYCMSNSLLTKRAHCPTNRAIWI